jgi:hypothetical protein
MNRYRIYLGLNNPKTNQEYDKDDVINHIKMLFDYATIYQANGLYENELETTLIIEVISNDFTDNEIRNVCKYFKNRYEQECDMFTKDIINMEVI